MWRADQTTRPRKKYETPVPSAIFKCIFKQIEFRMFQWLGRPRKTFPEVVLNTCSYIYKSVYLNVVSYLRASLTQPKGKMGRQRQDWGEQSLKTLVDAKDIPKLCTSQLWSSWTKVKIFPSLLACTNCHCFELHSSQRSLYICINIFICVIMVFVLLLFSYNNHKLVKKTENTSDLCCTQELEQQRIMLWLYSYINDLYSIYIYVLSMYAVT
jgi:hypothetical protein